VADFSHHCPWLNTCITSGNFKAFFDYIRSFLLLLVVLLFLIIFKPGGAPSWQQKILFCPLLIVPWLTAFTFRVANRIHLNISVKEEFQNAREKGSAHNG